MKRKNVMTWAMMLCMGGIFTSCGLDMPKEVQTSYETMTVEKQDIEVPIKFSAKMKGQTDVTITPQVSGQLMKICVTEGEQVKKGQTLFIIDSRNASLELEAAEANLQAALAQENSAKLEYESNKNLFEKKIVSQYMLDNSQNSYKQAQASVAQARASVNRAKVNLGFCTITAPVAGVIGSIDVRGGDQVGPSTKLTVLSGNTTMDAEFSVTESVVEAQIQEGFTLKDKEKHLSQMPDVTFVMKNGTEYPHKGRITSLTGVVDAATGSLGVKATFPNPDGHLFSGVQGTVVLPYKQEGVIVIPQNALIHIQNQSVVYKVQPDSTAIAFSVDVVPTGDGKNVIVTKGLTVGEKIVTEGANNVKEGQKVLFPEEVNSEK